MTAEQIGVTKQVAVERALTRFFVVSGAGQGMRFYDPVNKRELTIHNIVSWINQLINNAESVGWSELVNKRWRALLPKAEYRPNQKPVFEIEPGFFVRNIWAAPDVVPDERCDPTFFIRFLDSAIGREEREYVIKWLAWQYQRPLDKPHTGLYLFGAQGTGKSTIAHILERVFGTTAVMRIADQSKLASMSNVDIWSRTLLIVEEVDVSIQDKLSNTIKSFMGTSHVDADRKHEHFGSYFIPANLIMLSNNPPTMLEKDDRRWYVKEMAPQSDPETYFKNFYRWLEHSGYRAIAHLLATTDISDMSLSDRPRHTDEKILACGMALKQDVLDVMKMIEDADGEVFTPAYFASVCSGNRLMHIASDVGLQCVDLNQLSGRTRSKAKGFSESECRRLLIPNNAQITRDAGAHNTWIYQKDGERLGPIGEFRSKNSIF